MPRFRVVYITIFLAILCMGNAQTLKFEQFTTKDGLLSDEVYNLHQDKKGYIWLFTNYGAMKYNGKTFEPVLKNLPFKESFIYSFYENEKGHIWVANSNANIFEVINDSAFSVKGTESASAVLRKEVSEIGQLYVDDSLNIYACSKAFSYKFMKDKGYAPVMLSTNFFNDSIYHQVFEIKKEVILTVFNMFHRDSLISFKPDSMFKIKVMSGNEKAVYNFSVGKTRSCSAKKFKRFGKRLYFCACSKLYYIEDGRLQSDIDIHSLILFYAKDSRGHLWIAAYDGGLFEFDEKHVLIKHYFEKETVNCILFDSQHGMWVSTDGHGLFHCKRTDEAHYDETDTLGQSISLLKITNDRLFVGNTDGDLFISEGKGLQHLSVNTKFPESLDIVSSDSFYVVVSRFSVQKISKSGNSSHIVLSEKIRDFFYSYAVWQKGKDTLLFFTRKNIILLCHYKIEKIIRVDVKLNCMDVRKRNVFLGTDDGVYELKNDMLVQPSCLSPTKNCIINKGYTDSHDNYWICTKGSGLFRLSSKNELSHYMPDSGLPSAIVNNISAIGDHGMLLSTNKGLFYSVFDSVRSAFSVWKMIYSEDVFNALEYKGKLYASTKNGLVIFDLDILSGSQNLYFNTVAVEVNSKPYRFFELNNLRHYENNLEFKFDMILFSSIVPGMKYRLAGPVAYSDATQEDNIIFRNLPPGSYTLTVEPDADNGANYRKAILFTINPAFWQTNWFYIGVLLLAAIVIVFGTWYSLRYYKNKELKKNEAERIIAEYRLIALKAQINPHFMSNCIAAIQHLILNNKVDEANEYLAKFSFLVRQVLNLSNKSLVPLMEEIEIIDLYMKLEQLRFDKIKIEFRVDPAIDLMGTLVPPILLQPIIENAIWHGLLPLGNKKIPVLLLIIKKEEGMLKMIVEDNGVGRKVRNGTIGNSRESKGIAITMQRIENLKYLNGRDVATISYDDLNNAEGEPEGTRVVISLPDNLHFIE